MCSVLSLLCFDRIASFWSARWSTDPVHNSFPTNVLGYCFFLNIISSYLHGL